MRDFAAALDAGAYGAKLTGAGLGGCVLALTETGDARTVSAALASSRSEKCCFTPCTSW